MMTSKIWGLFVFPFASPDHKMADITPSSTFSKQNRSEDSTAF
jgi:hypothetical protein